MISAPFDDCRQRRTLRARKTKLSRARMLGVLAVLMTLMAASSRSAHAEGGWISLGKGLSLVAAAQTGERGVLHRWAVVTRDLPIQPEVEVATHLTKWQALATPIMPGSISMPRRTVVAAEARTSGRLGLDLAHPMLAGLGLGLLILLIGWGLTRPTETEYRSSA